MDESQQTSIIERCDAAKCAVIAGRRVILAGHHLGAVGPWIEAFRKYEAADCFVVACAVGAGPLPDDSIGRYVLGVAGTTPSDEIRATDAALEALPADALAALDAFDPDRSALVFVPPHLGVGNVGGRPVLGARRPTWTALEDKTLADALFDRAGVRRAPSAIVEIDDLGELRAATAKLDAGQGVVWSGDARDGFHGGGDFVRWIRSAAEFESFSAWFAKCCDRVRVAPFLEGLPCSIHGFVADDGVAVFRPVEMLILRRPDDHADRSKFVYAGMSTAWDPADRDRVVMRDAARRVGRLLAEEVGYRGVYTVDGIMTADGFLPTEMNPRFGGALGYAHATLPMLGLPLVHFLAVEGHAPIVGINELEGLVVAAADARRWGSANMLLAAPSAGTTRYEVGGTGAITLGPGGAGTFARLEPDPDLVSPGPSFAPKVIEAFSRAERDLNLPVGALVAAPNVRG